jgi:hypothetical protein
MGYSRRALLRLAQTSRNRSRDQEVPSDPPPKQNQPDSGTAVTHDDIEQPGERRDSAVLDPAHEEEAQGTERGE